MKICLTANSGGHINELIQLKNYYDNHDVFFITDRNPLSIELSQKNKVYFVEKFIFKEVIRKLQFFKPVKNFFQSFCIIIKEKPDAVITTGAGVALGSWLSAKILFKKNIFIESAARIKTPSTYGKYIGARSDAVIVQWNQLRPFFKSPIYGGLVFNFDNRIKYKSPKQIKTIFVTTGTYKLQFNRIFMELDRIMASGKTGYSIAAQIGESGYTPQHYKSFRYCSQTEVHKYIDESDLVICQGGCGSIMDSLLRGKRVIAIPRLPEFKEYFDDHQVELVSELEQAGLILGVYDIHTLGDTIKKAALFRPDFKKLSNSNYDRILKEIIG
ncbi:MAG TPA: PssD/Cps14F family polysaccharide biosynthesis glycosyltransferase [Spirochaetota bacterium]|nr:PssD/Cps14F family polysaccharide biosynthesis glycosyltransferase [Spirochaetota bacterium]